MPMATPPSRRQATNQENVGAQPVSAEEPAKRNAATSNSFLRPNLSLSPPDASAPTRQPNRAQLFAQPLSHWLSSWKYFSKNGLAPPMTTKS